MANARILLINFGRGKISTENS